MQTLTLVNRVAIALFGLASGGYKVAGMQPFGTISLFFVLMALLAARS